MSRAFNVFLFNMDLPEPLEKESDPPDVLMGDDPAEEEAEDETEECPDCGGDGTDSEDGVCPTCGGCGYLEPDDEE